MKKIWGPGKIWVGGAPALT